MKQTELSKAAKVTRSTICRILNGTRNASPTLARRLIRIVAGTTLLDWVFAKQHAAKLTKLVDRL